jgi:outer membrane protein assembly factor BamB
MKQSKAPLGVYDSSLKEGGSMRPLLGPFARFVLSVAISATLSACSVSNWSTFRATNYNNGHGLDISANPVAGWFVSVGGAVQSSPAIAQDGTIVVGTDHNVVAIDPSGMIKWRYPANNIGFVHSSPAIGDDGTIYVGSDDHSLYAITNDGNKKWTKQLSAPVGGSPAVSGTTVYIADESGMVYALDTATGDQEWQFQINALIVDKPAIGPDGILYLGAYDGNIYALDQGERVDNRGNVSYSPNVKWHFQTGGQISTSPALSLTADKVFVGSDDGKMYAINTSNGMPAWAPYDTGGDMIESSAAVDLDKLLVFGTVGGEVIALNPTNGQELWHQYTDGPTSSPAVSGNGSILIGGYHTLWIMESSMGKITKTGDTGGVVVSGPVIGPHGQIYLGSFDGNVYETN